MWTPTFKEWQLQPVSCYPTKCSNLCGTFPNSNFFVEREALTHVFTSVLVFLSTELAERLGSGLTVGIEHSSLNAVV